ncbi:MAG TPA: GMC family oxidoreductase N-terminal domain-containing protein [Candidatus Acidoferrales bacterium]|nr:GMC family oxidoreductase N-terminal domain-containing protein [Candidatus Acidoferrales bacterium]
MKAIVVGSGAGGATAARKLIQNGYEVTILEAGKPFSPLTHKVSWLSGLRGSFLLKDENAIKRVFPHYRVIRASPDLALFMGITEGGCTPISCGNIVRAENGLKEIGLDLSPEFEEIEKSLTIAPIPKDRWRPLTQQMYNKAQELGYSPKPTPKVDALDKCVGCGYCELGCVTGAKWDSRRLYSEYLGKGVTLQTNTPIRKVLLEGNRAVGVEATHGLSTETYNADVIVLAAGGVGTSQILKASNLEAKDNLWIDIVLTVGGVSKGARMLNEPPMAWVIKKDNYILAPYFDILSYWFHKPWKSVGAEDRVGMMIKLADAENGAVSADGTVTKPLTQADIDGLERAKVEAKRIMEAAGVSGPFVDGMVHGGHLGGTIPLAKGDVESMHPAALPEGLWVADLSLMPRSQGLPTLLTAAALALRVSKKIIEANSKR